MLHIREDLAEAIAARKSAEQQLSDLLVQTHAAQLQMHSKSGSAAVLTDAEAILKRLTNELEGKRLEMSNEFKLDSKLKLYKEENENLRAYVTALHAEIFGARLAAKYLDKELAGRIQQMQLLGREVCPDLREKLWNEIESEIQVQRQKVMVKACQAQGRNRRHFASQLSLHRHASENETSRSSSVERISQIVEDVDNGVNTNQLLTEVADSNGNEDKKLRRRVAPVRTVTITRQETEGLGMSITGGAEHGVPILVSELYPDTPAGRCSSLHIGDSIVSVNGIDLRKVLHAEAVKILCTQPAGHTYLEVQYINPSDDLSDDDDILPENFKYGFFHGEESNSEPPNFKDSGDKTPTAPRTPEPSINDIVSENVPDY
ncbi:hypothetical protein QYM36_018483 [Artemia franciscana]|nr:hypothetical protein QYM36_018483 [Artemia franciscana]